MHASWARRDGAIPNTHLYKFSEAPKATRQYAFVSLQKTPMSLEFSNEQRVAMMRLSQRLPWALLQEATANCYDSCESQQLQQMGQWRLRDGNCTLVQ